MESHRGLKLAGRRDFSVLPSRSEARLEVEFGQLTDRGRVRSQNEDFLGHALPETPTEARARGWLFALADGVGGHERGEVASQAAVESLLVGFREAPAAEPPAALLARLVQDANARVLEMALAAGPAAAGMSTTLVACLLRYDRAVIAHVGDSRCYLIRQGQATQLTRDHTVAGDDLARSVLEHADLTAAAQALVGLASQRDGSDNISVQLIRIRSVERVGMYRGRPYRLR